MSGRTKRRPPSTSRSGATGAERRPQIPGPSTARDADPTEGGVVVRHYEAMYIVDAETPDEGLEPIIEKYKKIVADGGGEVVEAGKWERGRRPMAYEISKKREGIYILMQFQSDAAVPKELDRIFRISDDVIRHLVVRQNEDEE